MIETWKAIPGYEGSYEVSDLGQVRSLDRVVAVEGHPRFKSINRKGVVLKQTKNSKGRLTVRLSGRSIHVHVLVALAFLGPRPLGLVVAHMDGNEDNNTPKNLAYVTVQENCRHRVYHGSRWASPELVRSVRGVDTSAKGSLKALADKWGVPKQVIVNIKNGTCYNHVE